MNDSYKYYKRLLKTSSPKDYGLYLAKRKHRGGRKSNG